MTKPTPEHQVKRLKDLNTAYRSKIHDLEKRLAYRNAEAEGYKEEFLYLYQKEKQLLHHNDRLQKEVYRYQELYYDAQKELDTMAYYPKWVHWLFRKNAAFNAS